VGLVGGRGVELADDVGGSGVALEGVEGAFLLA
jgi:hypothetical protein